MVPKDRPEAHIDYVLARLANIKLANVEVIPILNRGIKFLTANIAIQSFHESLLTKVYIPK
jgi:hypothetical protein